MVKTDFTVKIQDSLSTYKGRPYIVSRWSVRKVVKRGYYLCCESKGWAACVMADVS